MDIVIDGLTKVFADRSDPSRSVTGGQQRLLEHRSRRVGDAARSVGLRQDDDAAHGGRVRNAHVRQSAAGRQRHYEHAAQSAGHGHGLPKLCAVPPLDGVGKCHLRFADAQKRLARGTKAAGGTGTGPGGPVRNGAAHAGPDVGRSAAAGGLARAIVNGAAGAAL